MAVCHAEQIAACMVLLILHLLLSIQRYIPHRYYD